VAQKQVAQESSAELALGRTSEGHPPRPDDDACIMRVFIRVQMPLFCFSSALDRFCFLQVRLPARKSPHGAPRNLSGSSGVIVIPPRQRKPLRHAVHHLSLTIAKSPPPLTGVKTSLCWF